MSIYHVVVYGVNQMMVQRTLAARTLGDAKKAYILMGYAAFPHLRPVLRLGPAVLGLLRRAGVCRRQQDRAGVRGRHRRAWVDGGGHRRRGGRRHVQLGLQPQLHGHGDHPGFLREVLQQALHAAAQPSRLPLVHRPLGGADGGAGHPVRRRRRRLGAGGPQQRWAPFS